MREGAGRWRRCGRVLPAGGALLVTGMIVTGWLRGRRMPSKASSPAALRSPISPSGRAATTRSLAGDEVVIRRGTLGSCYIDVDKQPALPIKRIG